MRKEQIFNKTILSSFQTNFPNHIQQRNNITNIFPTELKYLKLSYSGIEIEFSKNARHRLS